MRCKLGVMLMLGGLSSLQGQAFAGRPALFNLFKPSQPAARIQPVAQPVPTQAPTEGRIQPIAATQPVKAAPTVQPAVVSDVASDSAMEPLLEQLTRLSDQIAKSPEAANAWQLQLQQADVMLRLAEMAKGDERDNWLKLAIQSHYSAALQTSNNDQPGYERLKQLPELIQQRFPGNSLFAYAALQVVEADCARALERMEGDEAKVSSYRGRRLVRFAKSYPTTAEAPAALFEAAQISEKLGKTEEAASRYQLLMESHPSHALARKASGARWRLATGDEVVALELPQLYASQSGGIGYCNLAEMRGKFVVVYFWKSDSPSASQDFDALKQLTDRFLGKGLEVVYVNLDEKPVDARTYLVGRLTAGIHVHQKGSQKGGVVETFGIQTLPQAFLIARDGTLLKHSLAASAVEEIVAPLLLGRGR